MSKLHEVLAVESDLKEVSKKVSEEAKKTFSGKPQHFLGAIRSVQMFDENAPVEADQHQAMVTTVHDKLDYLREHVSKFLDVVLQKESTNQVARADIIVDDQTIASDVPATYLLGLESKLADLRHVYDQIPTLQPGVEWELDASRGEGVYRSKYPEEKVKTAKTVRHKVLYEATKEHPAQIEKWTEDEKVGKITINTWSSMLTPAEKSKLLGRIDKLIRAVKKARQRANGETVLKAEIGSSLFGYIHSS